MHSRYVTDDGSGGCPTDMHHGKSCWHTQNCWVPEPLREFESTNRPPPPPTDQKGFKKFPDPVFRRPGLRGAQLSGDLQVGTAHLTGRRLLGRNPLRRRNLLAGGNLQ
jgi:hypothetical protein